MHLEELDIYFPVCGDHSMAAIMHVVGQVVHDRLLWVGPNVGIEAILAEQFVNCWLQPLPEIRLWDRTTYHCCRSAGATGAER